MVVWKIRRRQKSCEHLRVTRCATDLKGHRAKITDRGSQIGTPCSLCYSAMFELPNVVCVISGMKLEAVIFFILLCIFRTTDC